VHLQSITSGRYGSLRNYKFTQYSFTPLGSTNVLYKRKQENKFDSRRSGMLAQRDKFESSPSIINPIPKSQPSEHLQQGHQHYPTSYLTIVFFSSVVLHLCLPAVGATAVVLSKFGFDGEETSKPISSQRDSVEINRDLEREWKEVPEDTFGL